MQTCTAHLDDLSARHTAFSSFHALVHAPGRYTPTFRLDILGEQDGLTLAAAYNRAASRSAVVWERRHGEFVALDPVEVDRRARNLPTCARSVA